MLISRARESFPYLGSLTSRHMLSGQNDRPCATVCCVRNGSEQAPVNLESIDQVSRTIKCRFSEQPGRTGTSRATGKMPNKKVGPVVLPRNAVVLREDRGFRLEQGDFEGADA
jgi:hypothetical protein